VKKLLTTIAIFYAPFLQDNNLYAKTKQFESKNFKIAKETYLIILFV